MNLWLLGACKHLIEWPEVEQSGSITSCTLRQCCATSFIRIRVGARFVTIFVVVWIPLMRTGGIVLVQRSVSDELAGAGQHPPCNLLHKVFASLNIRHYRLLSQPHRHGFWWWEEANQLYPFLHAGSSRSFVHAIMHHHQHHAHGHRHHPHRGVLASHLHSSHSSYYQAKFERYYWPLPTLVGAEDQMITLMRISRSKWRPRWWWLAASSNLVRHSLTLEAHVFIKMLPSPRIQKLVLIHSNLWIWT